MIIQYFPGEKRPSVYCCARFGNITLHPGDNEVAIEDWLKIKKHPYYRNDRNLGVIVEIRAKKSSAEKSSTKKKTAKEIQKEERIEAKKVLKEERKEERIEARKSARKEAKEAKETTEVVENADI